MGLGYDIHGTGDNFHRTVRGTVLPRSHGGWIVHNPGTHTNYRYPGVQFYLSCWYKRSEIGFRAALFFSAAALSGSFGGLFAAAIAKMNGIGNEPGWAWIVPFATLTID